MENALLASSSTLHSGRPREHGQLFFKAAEPDSRPAIATVKVSTYHLSGHQLAR